MKRQTKNSITNKHNNNKHIHNVDEDDGGVQWKEDDDGDENEDDDMLQSVFSKEDNLCGQQSTTKKMTHNNIEKEVDTVFDQLQKEPLFAEIPYDPEYSSLPGSRHRERRRKRREEQKQKLLLLNKDTSSTHKDHTNQSSHKKQRNRRQRSSFVRNKNETRDMSTNLFKEQQQTNDKSSITEKDYHSPLLDDLLEELVPTTSPKKTTIQTHTHPTNHYNKNKADNDNNNKKVPINPSSPPIIEKNNNLSSSSSNNNNKNIDYKKITSDEHQTPTNKSLMINTSNQEKRINDDPPHMNRKQMNSSNSIATRKNEQIVPNENKELVVEEEDFDNGIQWDNVDFDQIDNDCSTDHDLKTSNKSQQKQIITTTDADIICNGKDGILSNNQDIPRIEKDTIQTDDFDSGIQWDAVDFDTIENEAKQTIETSNSFPSKEKNNSVEDFGDFPDIDIQQFDNILNAAVATTPTNINYDDDDDKRPFGYTPYVILDISFDNSTFTKILHVQIEDDELPQSYNNILNIVLRDEWFFMSCAKGDSFHLVSRQSGSKRFIGQEELKLDSTTNTDLWIILHPHMWLTPTLISETIGCPRRAVLSNRCPSPTSSLNLSALAGSMKHELFQACLQEKNTSTQFCKNVIQNLVYNQFTKQILALPQLPTPVELVEPLHQTISQIQSFYQTYVQQSTHQLPGVHPQNQLSNFQLEHIHGIEESIVSLELGLKGNLDMTIIRGGKYFMPIELKTGHLQTIQQVHLAQLSLYTLLLKSRYSTSSEEGNCKENNNGLLLYLNDKSYKALNIQPTPAELSSLLGQRNNLAYSIHESKRRARGKLLRYEQDYIQSEEETKNENTKNPSVQDNVKEIEDGDNLVSLPELIPYSRKCEYCFSNRECMLYRATSKSSSSEGIDSFSKLQQYYTGHLHKMDFEYFKHWDSWIDLEEQSKKPAKWWLTSAEEASSNYIPFLAIDSSVSTTEDNSGSNHVTTVLKLNKKSIEKAHPNTSTSHSPISFEKGSYWILSLDKESQQKKELLQRGRKLRWVNLLCGYLQDYDDRHIFFRANTKDWMNLQSFIKYLEKVQDGPILFRLDKSESSTSGSSILRYNLIQLMTGDISGSFSSRNNENEMKHQNDGSQNKKRRIQLLRQLVVHCRKPSFDGKRIKSMFRTSSPPCHGCHIPDLVKEYSKLNIDQRNAVSKVICSNEYALIQGLPGTGKTSTTTFLTRLLVARGKRVLLTSYTHSAVDNLLLKLKESGMRKDSLVRIGQESSTHSGIHDLLFPNVDESHQSAWDLHKCMSNAKVVGVTALTIPKTPYINGQHFDFVIIDEAGQINQPASLGAIVAADQFVLVGDHEQLPPIVHSTLPEQKGYGISMLQRLAEIHPDIVAKLTIQYRMHDDICELCNLIVYNGELKSPMNNNIRRQQLLLQKMSHDSWISKSKILHPVGAVFFLNTDTIGFNEVTTDGGRGRHKRPITNLIEGQIVSDLVEKLLSCGLDAKSLGIISPFRSQVQLLCNEPKLMCARQKGVEISTIDRYQGRDKEVIIISFVRSNKSGKCGRLLQDYRRLNVAFSRAKKKLLMIGSFKTLRSGSQCLVSILDHLQKKDLVKDIPTDLTF